MSAVFPKRLLSRQAHVSEKLAPWPVPQQMRERLEQLCKLHKTKRGYMKVEHLPEDFCELMRSKNPGQALDWKLPFRMNSHDFFGVVEPGARFYVRRLKHEQMVASPNAINKVREERRAFGEEIERKIREGIALTDQETEFLKKTGPRTIDQKHRRALVKEKLRKEVEKERLKQPRTAAEMRHEVERLCQEMNYSPMRRLIELANSGALDPDEEVAVHKALLPYTAPQMSSVRVGEHSGQMIEVTVRRFEFVPEHAPEPGQKLPVADKDNNDIGTNFRPPPQRRTHEDTLTDAEKQREHGATEENLAQTKVGVQFVEQLKKETSGSP